MSKIHRSALLLSLFVLASCEDFDDPVSVEDPQAVTPGEQGPERTSADVGNDAQESVIVVDNTRPRLSLDVAIDGGLEPNGSITVTIEGTAVEKVVSGEVAVALPTMAAMEHAGAGKEPFYPKDRQLPTIASWAVPAMDEGGTWKQTFSFTLPEKGYYHMAVDADIDGPEGEKGDLFVMDDVQISRWMVVRDGGGFITLDFDPDVFAESDAPLPGPFRPKLGVGTASGTASDAAMDSDNDDYVYFDVVYYDHTRYYSAVGALASAHIWDPEEDEETSSESYYVPDDGVVAFNCPSSGSFLRGSVTLEATDEVDGADFDTYLQAANSQCGDTIMAVGSQYTYLPWYNLKTHAPAVADLIEIERTGRVGWRMEFTANRSYYDSSEDEIVFGYYSFDSEFTAAHEYGHALHEKALGGLWSFEDACLTHTIWGESGYRCALQEGFADYAATVVPGYNNYFEYPPDPGDNDPAKTEGYIAATFQDLIDSNSDGDDNTSYSAEYVFTVFKTCEVKIVVFWADRNDISDIVWCLEEGVDTSAHLAEFPDIILPLDQREDADEPSDHDAEDIRDTWIQNIGGDG